MVIRHTHRPRISDKEITTYKVVRIFQSNKGQEIFRSPIFGTIWWRGKILTDSREIEDILTPIQWTSDDEYKNISGWFYSFWSEDKALLEAYYYSLHSKDDDESEKGFAILKCSIPEHTQYYYDFMSGEVVSRSLVPLERLHIVTKNSEF